ncbi:MAG: hypothetical protein RLZZ373_2710 [Pseudomonadota bacterium]|jgi:hypothetical protein
MTTIAASVITYELGKRLGPEAAAAEFLRQATRSELDTAGDGDDLPAARCVRRLRRLGDVALIHDAGGTSIGIGRSRQFTMALATGADVWICIDDDLDCSSDTLKHLLGALNPEDEQIVIVPYWLRQQTPIVAVTLDPTNPLERVTKTGARLRRALTGGFGLVAVTRAAMLSMVQAWPGLEYLDGDGETRIGMFIEFIRAGFWYREDFAFFSRVPRSTRVEALFSGYTDHAGKPLRLETADQEPMMQVPRDILRMRETCGQEGGFVDPLRGHVQGRCSFATGHDGRHSWEPPAKEA